MALNEAFEAIRGLIANGIFKPGDKLPSENDLCITLKMSKSPVREALRMLEALNIIDIRHGSGIYVKNLEASELIESLSLAIGLMPLKSLLDMYDLRKIIESSLAERATVFINDNEVNKLSQIQNEIEQSPHPDDTADLDDAFHELIAETAHSPAAKALLKVMRLRSSNYRLFQTAHGDEIFRKSNAGHREIINALRKRDPILVKGAMAAHIEVTCKWLATLKPSAVAKPVSNDH